MRKWVLLLVLVVLAFFALLQTGYLNTLLPSATQNHEANRPTQKKSEALTPASFLETMRARYRLPPDRRLSEAVVLMAKLGGQSASDTPRFVQGHWEQLAGGTTVLFDDLPTYTQARQAMAPLAQEILRQIQSSDMQRLAADDAIRGLDPRIMQSELALLDGRWSAGDHSAQIIRRAAAATVRLLFVSLDDSDANDSLAAQAVALVALARAQGDKMPLEESMLAWRLGYENYALAEAEALPEEHPWRLYLARDDERLATVIKNDPEYAYLLLERLAAKDHADKWIEAMRRYGFRNGQPHIHMLATGMHISDMQIQGQIAFATPTLTILSMYFDRMGQDTENDLEQLRSNPSTERMSDTEAEQRQAMLNRALLSNRKKSTGPFLSLAVFDGYHRSFIESGMYVTAKVILYRRGDIAGARIYTNLLSTFGSEISQRMGNWLDALVSSHEGKPNLRGLMADIGNPALGIKLRRWSLDEWLRYSPMESAQNMEAVGNLVRGLDSRISHRYELADLARSHLYHLALADRLYASIGENESSRLSRLKPYLAYYNNDMDGLISMAEDTSLSDFERRSALQYLLDDDSSENMHKRMQRVYETLIHEAPKEWVLRKDYIKLLQKSGDHAEIIKQASQWLKIRDKDASVFNVWKVLIDLSNAYLAQGNLRMAWEVIEPQVDGEYGGIFKQAFKVKLASGEIDNAEAIALRMHQRYPDALYDLLPMVVVQWRRREYTNAAKLLKSWNQPISMNDWRFEIGKEFSEEVESHGLDAEATIDALKTAGVSVYEIHNLVLALGKNDPARAAVLAEQLHVPGLAQISLDLDTYSLITRANGQDAADKWLRQRVRTVRQDAVAGIAIERHTYSVPWRVAEAIGPNIDAIWLYRASVYAMGKEQSEGNRKQLDDYYSRQKNGTFYDQLGGMVLGRIREDIISYMPMSKRQISESAYYLGLHAISEGRYVDGAEWMRVSMETGEQSNGEYRFSMSHLIHWRDQVRSMSVLSATNKLF